MKKKKEVDKTILLQIDTKINKKGEVCAIHSFAFGYGGKVITEFAGLQDSNRASPLGAYSGEKSLLKQFAKMYKEHRRAEEVRSCSLSATEICMKRMTEKGLLNKKDVVSISLGSWGM